MSMKKHTLFQTDSRNIHVKIRQEMGSGNCTRLDSILFQNQNWEYDLTQGKADLYFKSFPGILLGYGLQHQLQVDLNQNFMSEISMYSSR